MSVRPADDRTRRSAPANGTISTDTSATDMGVAHREPGVEANARLTAATGLLLTVLLIAEGFTILAIHPLLSWHVAIGFALIPPVGVKLGSTGWRFARYYLGDARYRRAGPPQPALRLLGPIVVLSTVAVIASGVAAWIAGPGDNTLVTLHKASFVIWFGAMAIHFLAYIWRSLRWTSDDMSGRAATAPYRGARYGLILVGLAAGVAVAVATRGVATGWTHWHQHIQ